MKKILLSSLVATTLLLMGCGEEKPPQACYDMIEATASMAEQFDTTGQAKAQMPDLDKAKEELEERWGKMNDETREKTKQDCEKAGAMLNMLKGMKEKQ